MADDELNIRLKITPEQVSDAGVGASRAEAEASQAVGRMTVTMNELSRLERRLTRRLTRAAVRFGAGYAVGEISEYLGLEGTLLGRLGTSAITGLVMGGPTVAIVTVVMQTVAEVVSIVKSHADELKRIKAAEIKAVGERVEWFRKFDEEWSKRFDEQEERFRKGVAEELKKVDEDVYNVSQYVE
jgi:hypothetical protein